LQYGFRQIVNDAGASSKDTPISERIEDMKEGFERLKKGELERKNKGKGTGIKITAAQVKAASKEEIKLLRQIFGDASIDALLK
jgi:hypothetical protein